MCLVCGSATETGRNFCCDSHEKEFMRLLESESREDSFQQEDEDIAATMISSENIGVSNI